MSDLNDITQVDIKKFRIFRNHKSGCGHQMTQDRSSPQTTLHKVRSAFETKYIAANTRLQAKIHPKIVLGTGPLYYYWFDCFSHQKHNLWRYDSSDSRRHRTRPNTDVPDDSGKYLGREDLSRGPSTGDTRPTEHRQGRRQRRHRIQLPCVHKTCNHEMQ